MGNYRSGRPKSRHAKFTTSDCISIDVRQWQREGRLTPGEGFILDWYQPGQEITQMSVLPEQDRVIIGLSLRTSMTCVRTEIKLERTPCHYGGDRVWFLCPRTGCNRRVAILYGTHVIACRHCYNLAYPSQRETDQTRARRRANVIRKKLGWEPGFINGNQGKPKGMHWSTYFPLVWAHDRWAFKAMSIPDPYLQGYRATEKWMAEQGFED